ncbi:hypothetical protein ABK040_000668 [Willaertia magna]
MSLTNSTVKTISFFSSKPYLHKYVQDFNQKIYSTFYKQSHLKSPFHLKFIDAKLSEYTVELAERSNYVSVFVNDYVNRSVIESLSKNYKIPLIALRSVGYNNVDLKAAKEFNVKVVRVPEYSPNATADFTIALIMALNRRIHKSFQRIRECDFSLDGLMGFDMYTKTFGVIGGSGRIGKLVAKCLRLGFGARVIVYDEFKLPELEEIGVEYVTDLKDLYRQSDVITLHCPLIKGKTEHMINEEAISQMKDGVLIVNAARGGLCETKDLIEGVKNRKIGGLAIDVYEFEQELFYEDRREQIIKDDTFMRLITFPNVLVTPHQAFFTNDALLSIAERTLKSIYQFEVEGKVDPHVEVSYED